MNDERLEDEDEKPLLAVNEVAKWLNVSKATVFRLRASGELPAIPVGRSVRWKRTVVRAYMNRF